MSNVAVITARGGSKRIPRKNIKEFNGKPIIAYSIEAALKSNIFDEVMVSTDDEEIAEISAKYGAKVPFYRSEETSSDFATTMDVLQEVVGEYRARQREFEYLCCLYPTAPFVTVTKLIDGLKQLKKADADSLVPVVRYECPPQWSIKLEDNGLIRYNYPDQIEIRSQDLDVLYYDPGQFYWYNVARCFDNEMDKDNITTIILPESEVQDIDTEADWEVAEIKYKLLQSKLQ